MKPVSQIPTRGGEPTSLCPGATRGRSRSLSSLWSLLSSDEAAANDRVPCGAVQTRYLILAALATGLLILVASMVWFVTTFA